MICWKWYCQDYFIEAVSTDSCTIGLGGSDFFAGACLLILLTFGFRDVVSYCRLMVQYVLTFGFNYAVFSHGPLKLISVIRSGCIVLGFS